MRLDVKVRGRIGVRCMGLVGLVHGEMLSE